MNTTENVLVDRAIQLHGECLQSMRSSQKKWFIAAMAAVLTYAWALSAVALETPGGALVGLFAMPLFLVTFYAGRLAGRVEAIGRVRTLNRK